MLFDWLSLTQCYEIQSYGNAPWLAIFKVSNVFVDLKFKISATAGHSIK
jgi:hypothetical protein